MKPNILLIIHYTSTSNSFSTQNTNGGPEKTINHLQGIWGGSSTTYKIEPIYEWWNFTPNIELLYREVSSGVSLGGSV